jgi:mRNA-degrading endonuclease toxin of MazEF toxin-antitoxin module
VEVEPGGIYLYEPPQVSNSLQAALVVTSGSEQSGMRPWIIVSRHIISQGKPTAVGVPMTTRVDKANSYRIALPVAELISEVTSGYRFENSVALCDHVRVLDKNQIKRKIGRLSDNALAAVGLGLAYVFDFR